MKPLIERIASAMFVGLVVGVVSVAVPDSSRAQASASQTDQYALETHILDANPPLDSISADQPPAPVAAPGNPTTYSISTSPDENNWHFMVAPYLWFPGWYGTVGTLGRDVGVHASPADLLSHFRFGLMGLIEPRYKRLLFPVDLVWVRLGDNAALPSPMLNAITANVTGSEFILTPKVGFRAIDLKALKVDALGGLRYWHFGQTLQFTPSALGLKFSGSQNWIDPLIGGRIQVTPLPRLEVTIAGDVGGWGAAAQLDYQVVGLLGYRLNPRLTLQAGYRYLAVNYRSGGTIIDTAMPGALLGLSIAVIK